MKRNQKGFTLIELLAVIVILAIIALIATPMVLKYIEESRIGAAERSTEACVKAAETAYVVSLMGTTPMVPNEYAIGTETKLESGTEGAEGYVAPTIKLDVKNAPTVGTIKFTGVEGSEDVTVEASGLEINGYTCEYNAAAIGTEGEEGYKPAGAYCE